MAFRSVEKFGIILEETELSREGWGQFIRDELQSLSRQANGSRY